MSARTSLSKVTPSGRNSGNITLDMNNTVMRGTPRQNSMNPIEKVRIIGRSDCRPRASIIRTFSFELATRDGSKSAAHHLRHIGR